MMQLDHQGWHLRYQKEGSRYDPMERRLVHEHLLVAALCESHTGLSYKLIEAETLPPRDYRVVFQGLRSIVNIDHEQLPVFGTDHVMEIHLPSGYPLDAPICYMVSPIWHPNIQNEPGPYQGRICGNTEAFGAYYSLDALILRIKSMLLFETYHAELRFPYPEDEQVARWVREIAEPLGIVKQGVGIADPFELPADWKRLIATERRIRIKLL
jgi:hypothetical protein